MREFLPISIPGLDIEVSFQYHSDMCDIVIINERKQIRKRKRAPATRDHLPLFQALLRQTLCFPEKRYNLPS